MGVISEEVNKAIDPATANPESSSPETSAPTSSDESSSEPASTPESNSNESSEASGSAPQTDTQDKPEQEAQNRTNRNTLARLAMIYLAKAFADVAREAFQPPKAFAKIPKQDHLAVMYGGTIDFIGMQVSLFKAHAAEDFAAAGGLQGLMTRIEEAVATYDKRIAAELEKASVAQSAEQKGVQDEQAVVQ